MGKKIAFLRSSKIHEGTVEDFLKKKELEKSNKNLLEGKLSQTTPLDHLKTLTDILKAPPEWELKITALKIKGRDIDIQGKIEKSFYEVFKTRLQSLAENNILKEKKPTAEPQQVSTKKEPVPKAPEPESGEESQEEALPENTNLEPFSYSLRARENL